MDIQVTITYREGSYYARFDVTNADVGVGPEPTVFLSRSGEGCPCPVTDLGRHNDHSPGYKTRAACNAYVERIRLSVSCYYTGWLAGTYVGRTIEDGVFEVENVPAPPMNLKLIQLDLADDMHHAFKKAVQTAYGYMPSQAKFDANTYVPKSEYPGQS